MTAGSDGRICHYQWQPSYGQAETPSSLNKLQQTKANSQSHTKAQASETAKHSGDSVDASFGADSRLGTGESNNSCASSDGAEEEERKGENSSLSMRLVCVSEERLPNITTVQDVVQIPGSEQQLVCGFQVLLIGLLM